MKFYEFWVSEWGRLRNPQSRVAVWTCGRGNQFWCIEGTGRWGYIKNRTTMGCGGIIRGGNIRNKGFFLLPEGFFEGYWMRKPTGAFSASITENSCSELSSMKCHPLLTILVEQWKEIHRSPASLDSLVSVARQFPGISWSWPEPSRKRPVNRWLAPEQISKLIFSKVFEFTGNWMRHAFVFNPGMRGSSLIFLEDQVVELLTLACIARSSSSSIPK